MQKVLIVGSGASGVHFALSLLRKGYQVVMLDVGHIKSEEINPGNSLNELKTNLNNPVQYFLGNNYEAVVYPSEKDEYYTKYYGFPPSKSNIFSTPSDFKFEAKGFEPLLSFAKGGLAEAWTGGVYPMNEAELQEFPYSYQDIEPHYSEVAKRMGINGAEDDLARFFPHHAHLLEPLQLDEHSQHLVASYKKHKDKLNHTLKGYLGRSRVATIGHELDERPGCIYCGRCLWGCPQESLYTPSITLRACQKHPNFTYMPGYLVNHFTYDQAGKINSIVATAVGDQTAHEFTADTYVLAAGTISSSKIFLTSIYNQTGQLVKLPGLMDNRQILVPFVNLKMIGKQYNPESYQYHQIAIGLEREKPEEYVHGQVTTLKSALVHPIIQNMPLDLRTATFMFRNMRASLGIVNLNLHDRRRDDSYIALEDQGTAKPKLVINYTPSQEEPEIINESLKRLKKLLWKLRCIAPPNMIHIRPMGASVHYTGTLPMSTKKLPYTTSKDCQSHDFENLYIVDGTTFPFLPAKNVTFSLMANAVRVAETAF